MAYAIVSFCFIQNISLELLHIPIVYLGACTDTLSYCTALLFQSLEDFSDVLDAASLLVFEEVKSSEFEQKYNELIGLSVEIVNTTLLALADLDYMGLLNNVSFDLLLC